MVLSSTDPALSTLGSDFSKRGAKSKHGAEPLTLINGAGYGETLVEIEFGTL